MERMFVRLTIPRPYNGGEWRISQQVTGPRGGKKWETIISQPATGGEYRTDLLPGLYKETYWINGWPTSRTFIIEDCGVTKDISGDQWQEFRLVDSDGELVERYLVSEVTE